MSREIFSRTESRTVGASDCYGQRVLSIFRVRVGSGSSGRRTRPFPLYSGADAGKFDLAHCTGETAGVKPGRRVCAALRPLHRAQSIIREARLGMDAIRPCQLEIRHAARRRIRVEHAREHWHGGRIRDARQTIGVEGAEGNAAHQERGKLGNVERDRDITFPAS